MFPKNDPYRDWFNSRNSFDPFDWSDLFNPSSQSTKENTQEDTTPDDETNELTQQGRDVLGFYRVLQTIDAAKNVSALDWMKVYARMKITDEDQKILAQVFLTFTQDKVRKDMQGQPGEKLANAFMDMFADEINKQLKKSR